MDKDFKSIEKYAEEHNIPIMEKTGIKFLTKYIEENNVKSILEIGSAIGYSAIKMALVNENIKITTIEKDNVRYMEALKNIKDFGLEKRITLIYGDALLLNIEDKYDLIFIDAAKGQYINFFEKYSKNLNKKGVIISDNIDFHGLVNKEERIESKNLRQLVDKIRRYIDFLKENASFETTFYKVGDGVSISRKREIN
ncbi:o-methyltransferase family protein [Clostridium sp. CAG:1193]|nr:o-methyltransferase family protein [Clostridium sp. CAG:1193]